MAGEVSSVWNLAPKRKEKVKLMYFSNHLKMRILKTSLLLSEFFVINNIGLYFYPLQHSNSASNKS